MIQSEVTFNILSKRNILFFISSLALCAGIGLQIVALVILGTFLLALLALGFFMSFRLLDDFEIIREHYPHAFEESKLEVRLNCKHQSRLPIHLLTLTDEFNPGDPFYVQQLVTRPLPRKHEIQFQYQGNCSRRRGLYVIGPIKLNAADPMGIFQCSRKIDILTTLYLLPKSQAIDSMPLLSKGTLFHIGEETLNKVGNSESFVHLREYRWGDNPRQVHWPTSARLGKLIIRELEDTVMTDVNIFLDMRKIAQRGVGDMTSTEFIIKSAACVAQTAIEKSHRVQFFCIGRQEKHIPLGEGVAHLYHILKQMALWKPQGETDFIEQANRQFYQVRPGSTMVWIVSVSVFDPNWLEQTLPRFLLDGVKIILILIDDRTFLKIYGEQDTFHHHGFQTEELIERFKNLGCTVYTMGREDDLVHQLSMAE